MRFLLKTHNLIKLTVLLILLGAGLFIYNRSSSHNMKADIVNVEPAPRVQNQVNGSFVDEHGVRQTVEANPSTALIKLDQFTPTGSIIINGGAATTNNNIVTLTVQAQSKYSPISYLNISNNNSAFSYRIPYSHTITWDLSDRNYGGTDLSGLKTIYYEFVDTSDSRSIRYSASINYNNPAPPPPKPPCGGQTTTVTSSPTNYGQYLSAVIGLGKINYKSYSLNNESVEIKNTGNASSNLGNWTLRNSKRQSIKLPGYVLNQGTKVTIHTGRAPKLKCRTKITRVRNKKGRWTIKRVKTCPTRPPGHIYLSKSRKFWNRKHDSIRLYNSSGQLIANKNY